MREIGFTGDGWRNFSTPPARDDGGGDRIDGASMTT